MPGSTAFSSRVISKSGRPALIMVFLALAACPTGMNFGLFNGTTGLCGRGGPGGPGRRAPPSPADRESTRLNSRHRPKSYALFFLKKKKQKTQRQQLQRDTCD